MALAMATSFLWKPAAKLGSKDGQLAGVRISVAAARPQQLRLPMVVQPLASKVCQLTGKKYNNAMRVSYSHHRTKKKQQPNLQKKRLWWERAKKFVRLRICTSALKTIDKKGLETMAKEAGINLSHYVCN